MGTNILCRLCALSSSNFVAIYEEEGQKLNLATKIIQCLQIWLYPEDVLPKTVCVECCNKLDQYWEFFELCSQSQVSLLDMYSGCEKRQPVVGVEGDTAKGHCCMGGEEEENKLVEMKVTTQNDDFANGGTGEEEHDDADDVDRDELDQDSADCLLLAKEKRTSRRKLRTPVKRTAVADEKVAGARLKRTRSRPRGRVGGGGKRGAGAAVRVRRQRPAAAVIVPVSKQPPSPQAVLVDEQAVQAEEEEGSDWHSVDMPATTPQASARGTLQGYTWKCTDCEAELGSLSALKTHHADVHNQPPNYGCAHCTKVYTRYRSFARHVKLHGNPKKYSCDVCGKCFSQKTVLQSHGTVHSEARPHVCTQCGKAFKQFSSLYLHSKCHLPDQVKPRFPCSVCPKQFSTKHTLDTHFKIHTGERDFVCDVCGKSFIAKGSLDYHILTHNEAKPHACPVCGKGFKTARLLTKHTSLHTGIKPHQCDVCGKQFRERGALREHNRIHTGAMPYACDFCGKLFRFKGILTVHRRQHTGERPYSCAECRRQFTNWANYNKHMKRRHRHSEHNIATATRILQRQQQQAIVSNEAIDEAPATAEMVIKSPNGMVAAPPPAYVHPHDPAAAIANPPQCGYKMVHDPADYPHHYRIPPSYIPPGLGYYTLHGTALHQQILHTRNQ